MTGLVPVRRRRVTVSSAWLVPVLLSAVLMVVVAAAAAAAIESRTVSSFGRGLWWSISLITTVGFIGETAAGALLSAVLMVLGFLLLAMVSASLAALFVRQEERPRDDVEEAAAAVILEILQRIERRLTLLEQRSGIRDPGGSPNSGRPDPLE